jgi:hypothetical protein
MKPYTSPNTSRKRRRPQNEYTIGAYTRWKQKSAEEKSIQSNGIM